MIASQPTPLEPLHRELGARLTDFAGWSLPLSFAGTLAEHRQVREACGLFDVSHMAQFALRGPGAAAALGRLLPLRPAALKPGRGRYSVMCAADGGIIDDLIVSCDGASDYHVVSNASRAAAVASHAAAAIGPDCEWTRLENRALLALQGPRAAAVCAGLFPAAAELGFMGSAWLEHAGKPVRVMRCGYTGEDGFEFSVAGAQAVPLARALLAAEACAPAGLGARDVLRLEAGLCLYGQDLDERTSICAAGLQWLVPPALRAEPAFIGAERFAAENEHGCPERLVGLVLEGRTPARAGAPVQLDGEEVGKVTSGCFSPNLGQPIALARLASERIDPAASYAAVVRGRELPCRLRELPFVPHRYFSQKSVSAK
ncbi:MAG: glycine cleavage system aminomethyltransferase GcvT [Betaproteobacteria bacterium AqS2]|uniref:aminomethyltransferase n=1 Tax=Candidatus Amphirhobacter heronislandensis TaxID=1732024 RepID=A0A930XXT0_9GAMM|nr:glycine cleavage system aminomethyltransferase GcvT [Betaproteobacteria bacterium AqS2]